jgi:S1-C subfamily serine protease
MNLKSRVGWILACLIVCVLAPTAAHADTLKLRDGTTVEGTVSVIGTTYTVKLADGTTRKINKSEIAEHTKAAPVAAGKGAAASADTPPTVAPAVSGGAALMTVKSKADRVESPIIAVQMWEKFLDGKPDPADAETAKTELAKWQKLEKDKAEKINGKWVGGAEKKELLKRVRELVAEGYKSLDSAQTLEGVKKLEDAVKLYPNSFEANFGLGYFYMVKGAVGATGRGNVAFQEKAVKSLETATKLRPQSPSAWSNLAIAYNYRSRYIDSVNAAHKAVKIHDSKETVQNLVNSIAHAPPAMQRNNETLKPIIEDTFVLAGKYGIARTGGSWTYLPPTLDKEAAPGAPSEVAKEGRPGPAWSGSGFFISGDGYLLTNHHVATGDPKSPPLKNISFRVRLDDGTEKNAELVAVDDKADIALMKIKTDKSPVPFLQVADDNPKQAAKALVLGYPVTGEEEPTLQISEGQVKSLHPGAEHEVWFDLNTTHGNSGGPIVDRTGRVIGILSGGRQVFNVTYVMGVGAKQIQTFLSTVGAKAPKVTYAAVGTGEFDGEKLTEQGRKATVLIIAIRGAEQPPAGATATTQPSE